MYLLVIKSLGMSLLVNQPTTHKHFIHQSCTYHISEEKTPCSLEPLRQMNRLVSLWAMKKVWNICCPALGEL